MRTIFGLVILALASCTQVITERLPPQQVDGSWRTQIVTWNTGARVSFAFKAFERHGNTAICGLWAESPGGDYNQGVFNERMVNTRRLEAGGKTLMNDISWFAKGRYSAGGAPEGRANCRATDQPWLDGYARSVTLKASRTRYVIRD